MNEPQEQEVVHLSTGYAILSTDTKRTVTEGKSDEYVAEIDRRE